MKKKARTVFAIVFAIVLLLLATIYIFAINFLVDFSMKKDFRFGLFKSEQKSEASNDESQAEPDFWGANLEEFLESHTFEKKEYVGYDGGK